MIVRALVTIVAVIAVVALAVALIWPWAPPEVDWRTAAGRALAANDCKTATTIARTAADAGVAEANEMAVGLAKTGPCTDRAYGGGAYATFVSLFRRSDDSSDEIYGLTANDLGFPRHRFVSASLFLCVRPYNGLRRIDHAAISKVMPNGDGPLLAFHRLRRDACMGILQSVTEGLVDAADASAHDVAFRLLMYPPLYETTAADFLFARLLLEKGAVSPVMRDGNIASTMRDLALLRLKNAARTGHVPSLHLIVGLLHEGRYNAHDDQEAYFWILRLRHLGHDPGPLAKQIEANLSLEDRESAEAREADDREGPIVFSLDDGERS